VPTKSQNRTTFVAIGILLTIIVPILCYSAVSNTSERSAIEPFEADIEALQQLQPAEGMRVARARLSESVRETSTLQAQIVAAETNLALAREDLAVLPVRSRHAQEDFGRLESEVVQANSQRVQAKQTFAEYEATVPGMKAQVRRATAERCESQYQQSVLVIKEARKQRDEQRVRIGAIPSVQGEIQYVRVQIRKARRSADISHAHLVRQAFGRIDSAVADLRSKVEEAEARVARVDSDKSNIRSRLRANEEAIALAHSRIETLPDQLVKLRTQLDRSESLKTRMEEVVRIAEIRLRDHNRDLAEKRTAEKQGAWNPSRSSTTTTSRSTSAAPISRYNSQPSSSSRYYDPTYRPPVGSHYVKGHTRRDGTYVRGHRRTNPDGSFYNNWSSSGNVNPNSGIVGTKRPRW
jgi:chromosome segregation ATPase